MKKQLYDRESLIKAVKNYCEENGIKLGTKVHEMEK